jgi:predicted acyl esterase
MYGPDEIHKWHFTLDPVAFELAPGERLRLEIASSAFPLYDRNPSSEVPPQHADNWSWARSTQQILHTSVYPSALQLPLKGEARW